MDKISQSKNELENIKILLERKSKEVEIIKQVSNQINKSLDLNLIASLSRLASFSPVKIKEINL